MKQRKNTSLSPDPNSIRSKKRKNRGFKSLEQSSRKHRRAKERLVIACTINRQVYKPGDKVNDSSNTPAFTAGGSLRYHV